MNKITCGLFMYRGKYFWKNFRDIHIFFERIFFTLKHGYSPVAKWETFAWFIDVMKEILTNYRYNRCGDQILIDNYLNNDGTENRDENEEANNKLFDRMIELLNKMDERNEIYNDMDWKAKDRLINNAKNEFFKLFSEYFFSLWD